MARKTRYTVYDMLDEKGVFEANPANACSPQYKGPVEYPKMLYHPKGAKRQTVPEQKVATAIGVQTIPAQFEMITQNAGNVEEEQELVSKGWHRHPRDAMAAAGETELPPVLPLPDAADLEEQIRRLTSQLAEVKKASSAKQAA